MITVIGTFYVERFGYVTLPGTYQGGTVICKVNTNYPSYYRAGWLEHYRILVGAKSVMARYSVLHNNQVECRLMGYSGHLAFMPYIRRVFRPFYVTFWYEHP